MNYEQANRILDRATEGWEFSEFVILRALELTGDYEPNGGNRMDSQVQSQDEDRWEDSSVELVADHVRRHRQA
jgi:hypothetical protein